MDDSRNSGDETSASLYYSFDSTLTTKDSVEKAIEANEESAFSIDELVLNVESNVLLNNNNNKNIMEKINAIEDNSKKSDVLAIRGISRNLFGNCNILSSTPTRSIKRGIPIVSDIAIPEKSFHLYNIIEEDKENRLSLNNRRQTINSLSAGQDMIKENGAVATVALTNAAFDSLPDVKRDNQEQQSSLLKTPTNESLKLKSPERQNSNESTPTNESHQKNLSNISIPVVLINDEPNDLAQIEGQVERNNEQIEENKQQSKPQQPKSPKSPSKLLKKLKRQSTAYNNAVRRMSVVCKTTLNSPVRKIARKSMAFGSIHNIPTQNKQRKSLLPIPSSQQPSKKTPAPSMISSEESNKNNPKNTAVADKQQIPDKRKTMNGNKNSEELVCSICSQKFRLHSLFDAHQKTHEDKSATVRYIEKNLCISLTNTLEKQCKFCDTKFAFVKALTNHLLEKCTKIPPLEKKKLNAAQQNEFKLPKATHHKMPCQTRKSQYLSVPINSSSSKSSLSSDITANDDAGPSCSSTKIQSMGPPQQNVSISANKIKKKLAHSGVHQTPNKSISCHLCKMLFNNILAFTDHSLTHSNSNESKKSNDEISPPISFSTQTENRKSVDDATQTSPPI